MSLEEEKKNNNLIIYQNFFQEPNFNNSIYISSSESEDYDDLESSDSDDTLSQESQELDEKYYIVDNMVIDNSQQIYSESDNSDDSDDSDNSDNSDEQSNQWYTYSEESSEIEDNI